MARRSFKKIDFTDAEIKVMKKNLSDRVDDLMRQVNRVSMLYGLIASGRELDGYAENGEIASICFEYCPPSTDVEESLYKKLVSKDVAKAFRFEERWEEQLKAWEKAEAEFQAKLEKEKAERLANEAV